MFISWKLHPHWTEIRLDGWMAPLGHTRMAFAHALQGQPSIDSSQKGMQPVF